MKRISCVLGFLLLTIPVYGESLTCYDVVTSTQVLTINVQFEQIDYASMFTKFHIAYLLGLSEVTFAQPIRAMVGLVPVTAYAHITKFDKSESTIWFEVYSPMRAYCDGRTLKQLRKE